MIGRIYIITNDVNSKVYVGQTVKSLKDRFCGHTCDSNKSNMLIRKAILKYGKQNFHISLLEECDISEMDEREIYWISYYNSCDSKHGYNILPGGSRSTFSYNRLEDHIDIQNFKDFICNNHPHIMEVANKFNISKCSVYNLMKRLGISKIHLNSYNPRKPKTVNDINEEELIALYLDGWSIRDLVKKYHITKNRISSYLKSKGITIRRGKRGYKSRI